MSHHYNFENITETAVMEMEKAKTAQGSSNTGRERYVAVATKRLFGGWRVLLSHNRNEWEVRVRRNRTANDLVAAWTSNRYGTGPPAWSLNVDSRVMSVTQPEAIER